MGANNYYQAARECEKRSSHLVAINSKAENTFIAKLAREKIGRNIWGVYLGKSVAKRRKLVVCRTH